MADPEVAKPPPWWEKVEPDWPDVHACMCPCGTTLQGGLTQFRRHWLVVHRGRVGS